MIIQAPITMAAQRLTSLAKIYSSPSGTGGEVDHSILVNGSTYKSGLTPVTPISNALAMYQKERFHGINITQKYWCSPLMWRIGFTIAELREQNALAYETTGLNEETLDKFHIHPCFALEKWKRPTPTNIADFPLGLDRRGYWNVGGTVCRHSHHP